jgi:hypothetical protein
MRVTCRWHQHTTWMITLCDGESVSTPHGLVCSRAGVVSAGTSVCGSGVTDLGGGFSVVVEPAERRRPAPTESLPPVFLLHVSMVVAATVVVLWAGVILGPAPAHDTTAGLADARRRILFSGGTSPQSGRPTFAATGAVKTAIDAPRLRDGEPAVRRRVVGSGQPRPPSLDALIDIVASSLDGQGGAQPVHAMGLHIDAVSMSPVRAAGVGGLAPKEPPLGQRGVGVVAAGADMHIETRRPEERPEDNADKTPPTVERAVAVSGAVDDSVEIDPFVRAHFERVVRRHDNVIASCYAGFGLAPSPQAAGHLTLSFDVAASGVPTAVSALVSDDLLDGVAACVERAVPSWRLGEGIVTSPTRLVFGFHLRKKT